MDDEFVTYLKGKLSEGIITSFDNIDLLLWGARDQNSVKLLGITLTVGLVNLNWIANKIILLENKISRIVLIASKLSQKCRIKFVVIFYSLSDEPFFLITDHNVNPTDLRKLKRVDEKQMPSVIQHLFNTEFGSHGTGKQVNKTTSDWFHEWSRANLPTEYVKANIDGLLLNEKDEPEIVLETKRSFSDASGWSPYYADARNYHFEGLLAKIAEIEFWTVYHKKGELINDSSNVALFAITDTALTGADWLKYERFNIKAKEVLDIIRTKQKEKR